MINSMCETFLFCHQGISPFSSPPHVVHLGARVVVTTSMRCRILRKNEMTKIVCNVPEVELRESDFSSHVRNW